MLPALLARYGSTPSCCSLFFIIVTAGPSCILSSIYLDPPADGLREAVGHHPVPLSSRGPHVSATPSDGSSSLLSSRGVPFSSTNRVKVPPPPPARQTRIDCRPSWMARPRRPGPASRQARLDLWEASLTMLMLCRLLSRGGFLLDVPMARRRKRAHRTRKPSQASYPKGRRSRIRPPEAPCS